MKTTYCLLRTRTDLASLLSSLLLVSGCIGFAGREAPFKPDEPVATEMVAVGGDTTFVLRGPSYYLLASRRSVLWHKAAVDDAAWRYRWLFGSQPPLVAIRLDSADVASDSVGSWRGVPLVVARVADVRSDRQGRATGAGMVSARQLTSRAARAWLGVASSDSARGPSAERVHYPAWFEVGTLRLLGSIQQAEGFDEENFGTRRTSIPLATLFETVLTPGEADRGERDSGIVDQRTGEIRPTARDARRSGGPYFAAQSGSVLAFLRERDPSFVATLPRELARGRSMVELLTTSTGLPHDIPALDAQWRRWAQRAARSASRN